MYIKRIICAREYNNELILFTHTRIKIKKIERKLIKLRKSDNLNIYVFILFKLNTNVEI